MAKAKQGCISSKKGKSRTANDGEGHGNLYIAEKITIEKEAYAHHDASRAWENKKLCFPFDCRPDGLFYQVFDEWKVFFKYQSASFISYEDDEKKKATVFVIELNSNGEYDYRSYEINSNGDWRSAQVDAIMKNSDIIIANPCGKQVKTFVPHVIGTLQKKILILGSIDVDSYAEIEPFFRNETNRLRAGYFGNFGAKFIIKDKDLYSNVGYHFEKIGTSSNAKYTKPISRWWWTNMECVNAYKTPLTFRKFEDVVADGFVRRMKFYDAIEISECCHVPCDYYGVIAVPESFHNNFNTDEWELLDANDYRISPDVKEKPYGIIKDNESMIIAQNENGEWYDVGKQRRILIRRKVK